MPIGRSPENPSPDGTPDGGNDPLREELRSLGYLENPLGRFFAGGLTSPRPALGTHLRVGFAVGVALGILIAALSLPIVLAAPGHTDRTLALTLAGVGFCVSLVVGLAAAFVMFALYRATRHLFERPELIARSTGIAIFALAFFYLSAFGWHYASTLERQWHIPQPWFAAGFGCAIALLAYLTARVFHLASYAVMAALGYELGRRRRGARRALAIALCGAAATACLVVFLAPRAEAPSFREQGDSIVPGDGIASQVVLVAIDGLDDADARAAIDHGWMPALGKLRDQGFSSAIVADASDIPPAFWTTVTTGLSTNRHRIDSYYEHRVLGLSQAAALGPTQGLVDSIVSLGRVLGLAEEVPVTASMSRVKRVVDVASEAGVATASINFWASYPATTFGGVTISERAYLVLRAAQNHGAPVDPEVVSNLELPALERFLYPPEEAARRLKAIGEFGLTGNRATTLPMLYDFFAQDAALEQLKRRPAPGFVQVGLTGLDILRYAYRQRDEAETDVKFQAHGRVLEDAYRALDGFLGRVAESIEPGGLLVIATCPGISAARSGARGLLVVNGTMAASGQTAATIRPESIAPTILDALGLPGSRELDGRVDSRWFDPEPLARRTRGPLPVTAYGQKPAVAKRDESSDETLRFLSEFGYLSPSR